MSSDAIDILHEVLKRNGYDADLRESDVDRYFFFDHIADPADLDLAWSQFPAHEQIRARAEHVDGVSDIVPGVGHRTPKGSNRCSDTELVNLVGRHLAAIHPFILREDYNANVLAFLEKPYEVQIVDEASAAEPEGNELVGTLNEAIGEFRLEHYSFEPAVKEVLSTWAASLTNCNEVALYLLWPVLDDVDHLDPDTPVPGFELWRYGCRSSYWIKDNDFQSGVVCVRPPWIERTTSTSDQHDQSPASSDVPAASQARLSGEMPERRNDRLGMTRRVFAALLLVVAYCGALPLLAGFITLATIAPPPSELDNSRLFPAELSQAFAVSYRDQILGSTLSIGRGLILLTIAVLAWIGRDRFFGLMVQADEAGSAKRWLRSFAWFAFVAVCFGIVGRETYPGLPSVTVQFASIHILEIIVPLGLAASALAFVVGWDLRVHVRDALVPYALAVVSALLSLRFVAKLTTEMIGHFLRLWQN